VLNSVISGLEVTAAISATTSYVLVFALLLLLHFMVTYSVRAKCNGIIAIPSGPGSSVGIATDYGLDDLEIE
jgi:hypothetical protein